MQTAVSLDGERLFSFFPLFRISTRQTQICQHTLETNSISISKSKIAFSPLQSKKCRQQHYEHDCLNIALYSVARIMKKALPENAKIAKEAKECVQECVSEFISFITSEGEASFCPKCHVNIPNWRFIIASDRCQQEKRKTINGEDILWAMQSLGFENYTEALKIYLGKYREVSCALKIGVAMCQHVCFLIDYKDRKNHSNR